MQPTIGSIVHYKLTRDAAIAICRRRTVIKTVAEGWPEGAQAHVGNPVMPGEVVPLVIVKVWPNIYGYGKPGVNGQVLLDGNDSLWVISAAEGEAEGQWMWPARA